jgi:hypothetical protein
MSTLDNFFANHPESRSLFDALLPLVAALGPLDQRLTRSQVAFYRRRAFAWAWCPGQYRPGRRAAPLALSLALSARDPSPRWKEIAEPRPGRFIHHLELYTPADLDAEVCLWLQEAWQAAA